jgi:hypothetical protein
MKTLKDRSALRMFLKLVDTLKVTRGCFTTELIWFARLNRMVSVIEGDYELDQL